MPSNRAAGMTEKSLTGTESFAARLLRSERFRIWLMVFALAATLLSVIARRAFGGAVMSVNRVFFPAAGVLLAGLAFQGLALAVTRRRARIGGQVPQWQRTLSVAIDLLVPAGLLLITQFNSPRGAYAALSGPSLLLMPLVILLSILRLRPWFSFWTGIGAAAIHAALASRAIQIAHLDADLTPVVFTYGALLAVTGVAAAAVSCMARRYVIEAVEEATLLERTQRSVALIEQDLQVARDIQMGLLPSERPQIEGFDVAGMARPAVCRAYARASAPTSAGPDALLAHLNDLIFDDVKGARFITMVVAIIAANGEIELVSAGHGPTLLFHASNRTVEWFGGDGLPLGIVPRETYGPLRQLRLDRGDVLVMLTDGFMEHMRTGDEEQFGTERLSAALRDHADGTSAQIIAAIDRAVAVFASGAAQTDDMTAVVIKRQ